MRFEQTQAALRRFLADIDYDLHKSYEADEETGEDTYPELTAKFLRYYDQS